MPSRASYRDEQSRLFNLCYYVADADVNPVVATTRPESIMDDTAMCINPKDPKNRWMRGHKVIVPLVGRVKPVIEDRYVDIEFGTGCLKVTPIIYANLCRQAIQSSSCVLR